MRHRTTMKSKQPGRDTSWWCTLSKEQKEDIEAGLSDLANDNKKDFAKVISKYK